MKFYLFLCILFFFSPLAIQAEEGDEDLLYEFLANSIAIFDIDDNVLNTKGSIKIRRYRYLPGATRLEYIYVDPATRREIPIRYYPISSPRAVLVDGPTNGQIRRLQSSGRPLSEWPEDLQKYYFTQLLPMFELPGIDPTVLGSRVMESTVPGMPNQFLTQIYRNGRRGILFDAPMLEILRRFLASPERALDVGFITSRRHEIEDLGEGFDFLTAQGVFDHAPPRELMAPVGNPKRNPEAHDPNVDLARLKTLDLSPRFDLAAARSKNLFFSDDDPSNIMACLKLYRERRARGELPHTGFLEAYTGEKKLEGAFHPVILMRPEKDAEPLYYSLEALLRVGRRLSPPSRPLPSTDVFPKCNRRIAG